MVDGRDLADIIAALNERYAGTPDNGTGQVEAMIRAELQALGVRVGEITKTRGEMGYIYNVPLLPEPGEIMVTIAKVSNG